MQDNELMSPEEDGEQQKEGRCKKTSNEEKTTDYDKAKGVLRTLRMAQLNSRMETNTG